jgi:hypothetical protein
MWRLFINATFSAMASMLDTMCDDKITMQSFARYDMGFVNLSLPSGSSPLLPHQFNYQNGWLILQGSCNTDMLPCVFATVPFVFVVSVMAVFAKVILGKYATLQNITFCFLFPVVIAFKLSDYTHFLYTIPVKEIICRITY